MLVHGEHGTNWNSYVHRPAQGKGGILLIAGPICAGASWGAFSTAGYIASGGDFFGKIAVEYLAYALGLYFAIGVPSLCFVRAACLSEKLSQGLSAETVRRVQALCWTRFCWAPPAMQPSSTPPTPRPSCRLCARCVHQPVYMWEPGMRDVLQLVVNRSRLIYEHRVLCEFMVDSAPNR